MSRTLLLPGLLVLLAGCPTPSKKQVAGKPGQTARSNVAGPTPPGAFPSLVTRETFALAPAARKPGLAPHTPRRVRERKPPARKPEQQQQQQTDNKPPEQRLPELTGPRAKLRGELLAAWEASPASWHRLAALLLYLLALDRPVEADELIRRKDALKGYDGRHFELNLALALLDRRLARSHKALERLAASLRGERALAPLRIAKALFAAGPVQTFGKQTERSNNTFRPGQFFRVYVELDNFVLSSGGDEQYNVSFKARMWLLSGSGKQYSPGADWQEPKQVDAAFRSRVKDIWMPFGGIVPQDLPPGNYEVVIELEDLNKKENQRATTRLAMVVGR